MQTKQVMGTQVYMSPEYKNGEISTKVDSFAFGLVVLEALTAYPISAPPGHANLLSMFEDTLDTPEKLLPHLDKRASWDQHSQECVKSLHNIAERCLESRRNRRSEIKDLIPKLEEVRNGAEALPDEVTVVQAVEEVRECVVCFGGRADVVGWVILLPCGHVCVCNTCSVGLAECPMCRQAVLECKNAFL